MMGRGREGGRVILSPISKTWIRYYTAHLADWPINSRYDKMVVNVYIVSLLFLACGGDRG